MPSGEVRFWIQPSTDRVVLFFVTLVGIFLLARLFKYLYKRSLKNRDEKLLKEKLERYHLMERPEESIVRELVERYGIRPPSQLLTSLQQFDSVATEEISRLEREKMDLADRLDRIEYLYSIRMNAFAKEPSVGGVEAILGSKYPGSSSPAEDETETMVKEAPGVEVEEEDPSEVLEALEETEGEGEMPFSDEEVTNLKTLLSIGEDDDEEEESPEESTEPTGS